MRWRFPLSLKFYDNDINKRLLRVYSVPSPVLCTIFPVPWNFSVLNLVTMSFSLLFWVLRELFQYKDHYPLGGKFLLLFPVLFFVCFSIFYSSLLVLPVIRIRPLEDWSFISSIPYFILPSLSKIFIASFILQSFFNL